MQHEAQTLNKLSNVKAGQKKNVVFLKKCVHSFFPVNTKYGIKHQP